ncbi:uncharacterized protein CFAP97D2-like [Mercenaria mercenaria]|uniref:uncharacterized protein CFAP97D2-like n=1 Tax=Mercenaria mercenaria TaxID=6596 RepID=UPI00234E99C7|nr:uncharacterized protein CFAP97D2-like [Mercenaria mercenaria]
MHRTYQPYTPVTCVLLKQRWDKNIYKCHRKKVHAARAVVDSGAPRVYQHLNVKLKKLQNEATRADVIDRDNRMLYNKIDHIMRTGGRTDNKNNYRNYSKSLNAAKHTRELVRVAEENSAILKRLAKTEPTCNYNHRNLLADWQESQQYLKNVSKYPTPLHVISRSPVRTIQGSGCDNK